VSVLTPAWLLPTARTVPWRPLIGVAGVLAVVAALSAYADQWPVALVGIGAAALAAAVVAGLSDPAAALLSAVPTSAARRRARRLVLLLPLGLGVWLAFAALGRVVEPGTTWSVGELCALTATGLAVAVWWPGRAAVGAGVATPLLWYAAARFGGLEGDGADMLLAWQHHPWIVIAVATTAVLWRRER